MGPGVSCSIPQPLVSFLPTIHHYLSNFSQLHKPGLEWRGDNKVYYRIFGGLMKTFVCTTHLASAIHMRIQDCKEMHVSSIPYVPYLLLAVFNSCDRRDTQNIYLYYADTTMATTPPNSAGRSLKSCSKLFYRIPTALYFFRESLQLLIKLAVVMCHFYALLSPFAIDFPLCGTM